MITRPRNGPVVYDFSITKSIFGMLFMLGLMVLLFGRMAGSYGRTVKAKPNRIDQHARANGRCSCATRSPCQHWREEGGPVFAVP